MPTNTRQYIDIDMDFTMHPVTNDIAKRKGVSAIMGSLNNLIQTGYYERLFKPQMGSNLRAILFEPMDTITALELKNHLRRTIENYEPRVDIHDITVKPDYELQQYDITMIFSILNDPNPISISFFLERVR